MKSEYCTLIEIVKSLNYMMKNTFPYSSGLEELTYTDLESYLNRLKKYTEISKMKEFDELVNAVAVSRTHPSSFFGSADKFRKQARDMVLSNIPVVISEIEKLRADKRTIKNENKEKIVQKIRSIVACENELKDIVNEYGRPKDAESSKDMWMKFYKPVNGDLLAALNELKFLDPDLECIDEFQSAMSALNISSGRGMTKRLMDARKTVDALVGMIKTEYKISDGDIEKPKNVVDLEKRVAELKEEVKRLNKELAEKPKEVTADITAIPKYKEGLKQLKDLQKELASQLGMNELVGKIKQTWNKIQPNVERIILYELVERTSTFDEKNRDFMDDTWDVSKHLKDLLDGKQLDETGVGILRQYSHELAEFIEKKSSELEIQTQ